MRALFLKKKHHGQIKKDMRMVKEIGIKREREREKERDREKMKTNRNIT